MNTRAQNIDYITQMIGKLGAETVIGPLLDDLKLAALGRLAATIAEPAGGEMSLDDLDALLNGIASRPALRQQVLTAIEAGKAEAFLENLTNPMLAKLATRLHVKHADHLAIARANLAGVDPARLERAMRVKDRNGRPFVAPSPRAEQQIRLLLAVGLA